MKATELMIGDWVYVTENFSQKYHRIREVSVTNGIFGTYINEYGIECNSALIEKCVEPIPLISKILEKNGFVKGYNRWDKEETSDDVFYPYEIHLEDEGHFVYCEIKTYDAFMQIKICDIHELQHALRLCGLNELADNFKV